MLSVPICLRLGVYALFWGISMVANPQTCDLKVMTSADLRQPETRGSESLIIGSELDYPVSYHSGYRDLNDHR